MWLTAYDTTRTWPPTEARFGSRVQVGKRKDFAWAELIPPIQRPDGAEWSTVLLGARHQGFSVWDPPSRWPIHVYVCTTSPDHWGGSSIPVDEVTIESWGLLHETRARALVDEF